MTAALLELIIVHVYINVYAPCSAKKAGPKVQKEV